MLVAPISSARNGKTRLPLPPGKPELLAPAGDWECARAAVANGADAVYFGLPAFNARLRATNFSKEEVGDLIAFLHEHRVKGYAVFNVLIFTDELAEAEAQLRFLAESGVDAILVQDLGLATLARQVAPGLALHASTQMTLTSPEGVAWAQRRLGIERAVLARELSLRELEKFDATHAAALPLEVFVHGALCVAYSGQCLTSEALGQRSANRGECAQACRLPYELLVDSVLRELGERKYLLSPQDLAAVAEIPELIRLGISCFKIEGRLKQPEYVAATTQIYRRAIDQAWAARATITEPPPSSPAERYQLEMTFSRGLTPGWLHGTNHQKLVHARFGKKRGALIGSVTAIARDAVEVRPLVPVQPGDGIVLERSGGDTDHEVGGRVYEVQSQPDGVVRLSFAYGKLDLRKIQPGDRIWKTDDPQLNRRLRQSWSDLPATVALPLDFRVAGASGTPLRIRARAGGAEVNVESQLVLQPARNRPLDAQVLAEQLGRLGGTNYRLGRLDFEVAGQVILPLSEINRLRRELVELIDSARADAEKTVPESAELEPSTALIEPALLEVKPSSPRMMEAPLLTVLCRSEQQIAAALVAGVTELYADFEDIRRYSDAVAMVRRASDRAQIILATPRIQKAGEQGFFRLIENAAPDGVLIRNLGALEFFAHGRLRRIGDFSLNVANPRTARLLRAEGLERLTVSYDLNAAQVLDLLGAGPADWYEITLHQHIPMFHMEHCVFAAFLSEGTDHTNCGRPCDRHRVELRDRVGLQHPVRADVGCRNTVFHAQAQSGAASFAEFRAAGPAAFRLELLDEDEAETTRLIGAYRRLLDGDLAGETLLRELRLRSQLGVTRSTRTD